MSTPNPLDDSLYNSMNSPTMGLAMGLLSAGGPSSTPVSLGQALDQGLQTTRQYRGQGSGTQDQEQQRQLLLALTRLMMARNGAGQIAPIASGGSAGGTP